MPPMEDATETKEPVIMSRPAAVWQATRRFARRHTKLITIAGSLIAAGILVAILWGRRDEFATALSSASIKVLLAASALQLVALLSRSEAWHVSINAAGGTVPRRVLYRASSMGYVGSLVNAQVGTAARIAALRRSSPEESPGISTLIAAEFPILGVEGSLPGLTSFTPVGPLGAAVVVADRVPRRGAGIERRPAPPGPARGAASLERTAGASQLACRRRAGGIRADRRLRPDPPQLDAAACRWGGCVAPRCDRRPDRDGHAHPAPDRPEHGRRGRGAHPRSSGRRRRGGGGAPVDRHRHGGWPCLRGLGRSRSPLGGQPRRSGVESAPEKSHEIP